MTFTKRQLDEKECLEWFGGSILERWPPQEGEFEAYLNHSERGIPLKVFKRGYEDMNVYAECKKLRGRFCEKETGDNKLPIYVEGLLEGTMPYFTILGGYDKAVKKPWYRRWFSKYRYDFYHNPPPRSVVDYMKKALFKGMDADVIEKCYQSILSEMKTQNIRA